jgi:RNA polymerase sigma factor (sigma-70 family)
MAPVRATGMPRTLRRALLALDRTALTDGQLLERYLAGHEEAAFEALVRRHGPMVLGVCRRVLKNAADAEDAFQATFLVLVRKGAGVRPRNRVGNWLYGVAYRTALKARSTTARRQARERRMSTPEAFEPAPADDWLPLLDHELNRLPEKYRLPIVLCDLEGKTRKEAARHLDWPEGTVATRLTRGRALLAGRLARHGVALSAGGLALGLSQMSSAAGMPASLVSSTVRAATDYAAGPAAAVAVSARVAALTEGVLKTMLLTRLKSLTAVTLLLGLLGAGLGTGLVPLPAAQDDNQPPSRRVAEPPDEGNRDDDADDSLHRLPTGEPPRQALVSLSEEGYLTAKFRVPAHYYVPVTTRTPDGNAVTSYRLKEAANLHRVQAVTYQGYTTKLKKIPAKELRKLLQEETPALVFTSGGKIDPLHLRFIKEGTLVIALKLPAPQPAPPVAVPPPLAPQPAPPLPAQPALVPPQRAPIFPQPAPIQSVQPTLPPQPAAMIPQPSLTPSPQPVCPPPVSVQAVQPAPAMTPILSQQPPPPEPARQPTPRISPLDILLNQGGTDQLLFRMQGEWTIVAQIRDGKRVEGDGYRDYRVVFRDGQMWLSRGTRVLGGKKLRVEIDASKKPATIDTYLDGKPGQLLSHGIIELRQEGGQQLLITYETPADQPRPTALQRSGPNDVKGFVTLYRRSSDGKAQ